MKKIRLAIVLINISIKAISGTTTDEPCFSIFDTDNLSVEQKDKLKSEVMEFQAQRKINGQAVCVQVDFLEQLPPIERGFTEDGKAIIRQDIYDQWQVKNSGKPAILFLFLKDPKQNKFILHNLASSYPLEQYIPDLIRRYIRDEIIKKQVAYYDAISAGMYAFSQALNQKYKQRLMESASKLIAQKKYHKGYAYDPFEYYYFKLTHIDEKQDIGCKECFFSNNYHHLFYKALPLPPHKEAPADPQAKVYDFYRGKELLYRQFPLNNEVAVKQEDEDLLYFLSGEEGFKPVTAIGYEYTYLDFSLPATEYTSIDDEHMPNGLKERLQQINNQPKEFKGWVFNKTVNPQSPLLFENDEKQCNTRVKVFSGKKAPGDPITMYEGLALSWNERFSNAQRTYCDAFASDLSELIFGKKLLGRATSTIEPMMASSNDFLEIHIDWSDKKRNDSFSKIWEYIDRGFIIYFVHGGDHIETGYPKEGEAFRTVGAGTATRIKPLSDKSTINFMQNKWGNSKSSTRGVRCFIYLGHLKKYKQ